MKRLIAIILSMTLLGGMLAGCNGTTGQSGSASASASASTSASASVAAKAVEILLWIFPQYDTFEDLVKGEYAKAIKAKYPNVTLNTELLSWDTGPEKLTVAMATKATPDFMMDGLSRLAPGIFAGLCADMTDVMTKVKGIVLEGFQTEGKVDGKNYYMPTATSNGYNYTVNATLAKELKVYDLLPADKIHWSYAQFLDFCRKATAAGKSKGIYATQLWAGSRSSDAAYYSFLMCGGTTLLNKEHTKFTGNTATAVASLKVLRTLIDEELVPDGAATTKDENVDPNFESGKLVLLPMSAGAQTPITLAAKFKKGDVKAFEVEKYSDAHS